MVITDASKHVKGIVSLSDILQFLVLDHCKETNSCSCPRSLPINLVIPGNNKTAVDTIVEGTVFTVGPTAN